MLRHIKRLGALASTSALLLSSSAFWTTLPTYAATPVTITASTTTATPGTAITLTASNPGIRQPEYQFWVEYPDGQWRATPYRANNQWTLPASQPGDYLVTVYVLSRQQVAQGDWAQAQHPVSPSVIWVQSHVGLSSITPAHAGIPVTVTAQIQNIYDPVYQFWTEAPDGKWTASGNYTSASTYTFTPSTTGTYHVVVYAKSPDAPNNWHGALAESETMTVTAATLFDQLNAENQTYFDQSAAASHAIFSAIPATGPNAGTVPVSLFNQPNILSQYHVPALPTSLAAANITVNTLPASQAILGENSTTLAQWTQSVQAISGISSITQAQVSQLITTAVQYLLDEDGNGMNATFLQNPESPTISGIRQATLQDIKANPADAVSALTGSQGILAQREYTYQEWANLSHTTITALPVADPYPVSHVVTTLQVNNIVVNLIMGGIYQGHEIIGVYPAPTTAVDVDLIQDNGQDQWYVSWASSGNTGNPSQVLWTGPVVQ